MIHRWMVLGPLFLACLPACEDVSYQDEVGQVIADDMAEVLMPELERLAEVGSEADLPDASLRQALRQAEPGGIRQLILSGRGSGTAGGGYFAVSRAIVVIPEEGDPYCIVVGFDSDGFARGVRADGDPGDTCRDARTVAPMDGPREAWSP